PPRSTPFPYTTLFRSSGNVNTEDDCFSAAIVEFLLEHFQIGGGLRLADQPAQRRDVLRVDERQPALLDGGQDRGVEARMLAQQRSEEHTSELQSLRHL